MKEPKKKVNYIENEDFAKALMDYKKKVSSAKKNKLPKPQIPSYIGECFLQIAQRLSYSPNFARYSYRDEMVADGVENCLMYFENFNPNAISARTGKKTAGPFQYFTRIILYAFFRRIAKEKKQSYVKAKVTMESSHIFDQLSQEELELIGTDTDHKFTSGSADPYDNISEFIQKFEDDIKKKKEKKLEKNKLKLENAEFDDLSE